MPRVAASRELLAPRADVWAVVSEPYHFSDWWPRIVGIQPDRRGFAPGARWQIQGDERPRLLQRPSAGGTLLVLAVEPRRRFAFQLVNERIDAELVLEETRRDRTVATLTVEGPWLVGLSRKLPRTALSRLYALCQTAADA